MTDFEELIVKLRRLPRFWHPIANAVGSMRVVALADVERIADELEALVAAQASPPTPEPMRQCLEWIASQTNLFFAECSQAEEIIHRVKLALASSLSDTGEPPT